MFDPTKPVNNASVTATELRGQFNGLKDLIDAAPGITGVVVDGVNTLNPGVGATVNLTLIGTQLHFSFGIPKGADGVSSLPVTSFVVDSVTTLNPGDAATASAMFNGASVLLNFGIPRGNDGTAGTNGTDGAQGPPFTNFMVDGVTTLNPGDNATVQATFDGSTVRLTFGIPRGDTGGNGNDGQTGPQGLPGEVSNAQLASAINDTSKVSNAVSTLGLAVSDPPTQAEMQSIANKVDELITALRR